MKKFRDLKVKKKLNFSFMIIVFLFLISQVASVLSIKSASRNMEEFYTKQFQKVNISRTMQMDFQGYAKGVYKLGLSHISESSEEVLEQRMAEMNTYLDELGANIIELEKQDNNIDSVQEQYEVLKNLTEQLLAYYENGQNDAAISLTEDQIIPAGTSMNESLQKIIDKSEQMAEDKYQNTKTGEIRLVVISIIITVIVIILSGVLCVLLTHGITRPLAEMEEVALALADGKLDKRIQYVSKDELGVLAESIRTTFTQLQNYVTELSTGMKAISVGKLNFKSTTEYRGDFIELRDSMTIISDNLAKIIMQIDESAEQVLRGAEQISGSGQALAQATLEQANSVEELSATINDISARTKENAENAMQTSNLTEEVGKEMTQSSNLMQNLSQDMKRMTGMSDNITGIVKDIEDIAFQTNILSLNAAVEAARAGDAGRGFSVVANEIRRLSGQTTEASRRTRELLNEIIKMMNTSEMQAQETAAQLLRVALAIQETIEKVDSISRASDEQTIAVVQLRESIELISDIVQENSATAEESAASSEELTGQMQMLKELVSSFEYDRY